MVCRRRNHMTVPISDAFNVERRLWERERSASSRAGVNL